MLVMLIVWCGCYVLAHTKNNNHQIPFKYITLINTQSFGICDLLSALRGSYTNSVVKEKKDTQLRSPINQSKPCDHGHMEKTPWAWTSPMWKEADQWMFLSRKGLVIMVIFHRHSAMFPMDCQSNTFCFLFLYYL